MDREAAIATLPEPYDSVIRLLDRGSDPIAITAHLGLDPETATALVAVAETKLAALLAPPTPSDETSPPT
jgi:hypothetical protein